MIFNWLGVLVIYFGILRYATSCGENLILSPTLSSDFITSPKLGTDGLYPLNSHCQWDISTVNSTAISLVFHDFDLEYHQHCSWDYVLVYYGACDDTTGTPTRYCGAIRPPSSIAISGHMCIIFHSDAIIAKTGFNSSVSLVTESEVFVAPIPTAPCQSSPFIINTTMIITSPNYGIQPKYPNNRICKWLVIPSKQNVTVVFDSFDLEYHANCGYDSLKLHNGTISSLPVLSSYCGNQLPTDLFFNEVTLLTFSSDVIVPKTGFKALLIFSDKQIQPQSTNTASPSTISELPSQSITVSSIDSMTPQSSMAASDTSIQVTTSSVNPSAISPSTTSTVSQNIDSTVTTLVQQLTSSTSSSPIPPSPAIYQMCSIESIELTKPVFIVSPNYGFNKQYPLNIDCQLILFTTYNQRISLSFIDLEVEKHDMCAWDKVIVYDGQTVSHPTLDTICGTRRPSLNSSGHSITIQFISDNIVTRRGFKAIIDTFQEISLSPTSTSSSLSSAPSTIIFESSSPPSLSSVSSSSSPSSSSPPPPPLPSPSSSSSSSPSSPPVPSSLQPLASPTSSTSLPPATSLPLSSPQPSSSKGTISYVIMPSTPTTSPTVTKSSPFTTGTWSTSNSFTTSSTPSIYQMCSIESIELIKAVYIVSPNYELNKQYPLNVDCKLKIYTTKNRRIHVSFVDFDVENHYQCAWDKVNVFDGDSVLYPKLDTLCGTKLVSLISTGNYITINFISDYIVTKRGFKAKIQFFGKALKVFSSPFGTTSTTATPFITSSVSTIPASTTISSSTSVYTSSKTNKPPLVSSPSATTSAPSTSTMFQATTSMSEKYPSLLSQITDATTPWSSLTTYLLPSSTARTKAMSVTFSASSSLSTPSVEPVESSTQSFPASSALSSKLSKTTLVSSTVFPTSPLMPVSAKSASSKPITVFPTSSVLSLVMSSIKTTTVVPTATSFQASSRLQTSKTAAIFSTTVFSTISVPATDISTTPPTTTTNPTSYFTSTEQPYKSSTPSADLLTTSWAVSDTVTEENMEIQSLDICKQSFLYITESTIIVTPNFGSGQQYPANVDCGLTIRTQRNWCISIHFVHFDVEYHSQCSWDYAVAYDGNSTSSRRLTRLCGLLQNQTLITTTNQIYIRFHSDNVVSKSGFRGVVSLKHSSGKVTVAYSINNTTQSTNVPTTTTISIPTSQDEQSPSTTVSSTAIASTATTTLDVLTEACSGIPMTLTSSNGYLESPGYSNNNTYPNDVECQWVIQAGINQVIYLQFLSFDVEYQELCEWDSVSVYDGSSSKAGLLIGKYCGNVTPPNTTSSGSKIYIKFITDRVVGKRGFKIEYSFEKPNNASSTCLFGWLPCNTGVCISKEWFCDGEIDCTDSEDESTCGKCKDGELPCYDGTCIPEYQKCDGISQCSDAEDEEGCTSVSADGRLMVMKSFTWFPVCDSTKWDKDFAHYACEATGRPGYISIGSKLLPKTAYVEPSQPLTHDSVGFHSKFKLSTTCSGGQSVTLQCKDRVCGKKPDNVQQAFIVGGSQSSVGEWPWVVAIISGEKHICGGTIIADQWILTAGHCVSAIAHSPQTTYVVVGKVHLKEEGIQKLKVSEFLLHPQHNFIYQADIALLRLQKAIVFTDTVRPLCLPTRLHTWSSSLPCYTAGWGATTNQATILQTTSDNLHHAKIKLWPQSKCKIVYPDKIQEFMICAGYETGHIDACKGDSGGPLMCNMGENQWKFVGITSWGEGCGQINKPGVYTRVDHYIDWIKQTTDTKAYSIDCNFETPTTCGYSDQSNTTMMWTRRTGGLNIPARPLTDVTAKNQTGAYMYAFIPYLDMGKSATLSSPDLNLAGDSCLMFWLNFHGGTDAILNVYGVQPNNETVELVQFQGVQSGWRLSEVDLTTDIHGILFVVQSFNKYDGGIAIDEINVSNSSCLGIKKLSCNFDGGTLCNYKQALDDSDDWKIKINLLPNIDARSLDGEKDHYLEADGANTLPGNLVKLISPSLNSTVPKCILFKYKISPAMSYTLSVCTIVNFSDTSYSNCHYWVRSSSTDDDWVGATAQLPPAPYSFQIGIQAKRQNILGIVALDEIKRKDGNCS